MSITTTTTKVYYEIVILLKILTTTCTTEQYKIKIGAGKDGKNFTKIINIHSHTGPNFTDGLNAGGDYRCRANASQQ